MLLPSSVGPANNGMTPLNPQIGARQTRQMQRVAIAAAIAKSAVLGYCTPPSSVAQYGANLMAEVQQAPATGATLDVQSTIPSGATAGGSGGFQAAGPAPGVNVAPIGSAGMPAAPPIPPLTTNQPIAMPPLWGAQPRFLRVARRQAACGRSRGSTYQPLPAGQAPTWGSAAAMVPAPGAAAPATCWSCVAGLALVIGGGLALVSMVGGSR